MVSTTALSCPVLPAEEKVNTQNTLLRLKHNSSEILLHSLHYANTFIVTAVAYSIFPFDCFHHKPSALEASGSTPVSLRVTHPSTTDCKTSINNTRGFAPRVRLSRSSLLWQSELQKNLV